MRFSSKRTKYLNTCKNEISAQSFVHAKGCLPRRDSAVLKDSHVQENGRFGIRDDWSKVENKPAKPFCAIDMQQSRLK